MRFNYNGREHILKWMQTWRLIVAMALVISTARVLAGSPKITSLTAGGDLVFETPNTGTLIHQYRVEEATSLRAAAWSMQRSVCGVGALSYVTNSVSTGADSMFYRVVATSNSATFVDGPYMTIDLSAGAAATRYPVTYYPSAVAVPGGVTNDTYKTTMLVMRKIPKGSFTMGSPVDELDRLTYETQHQVTLTKDFYIGVFEVTQRQWELVMGNRPSYFNNVSYYAMRPVEQVSYYNIRENPDNSDDPMANWPANNVVKSTSFMGRLRARTRLSTFDLPTESQWEYACRAGTGTAYNSGQNLTNSGSDPRMNAVGRYWYNGGSGFTQNGDTSVATAKAGSYLPNAWGIYDMHGNVWEWCLDWYADYPGSVQDPLGAALGANRGERGGSWYGYAWYCRSAIRSNFWPYYWSSSVGFRAAMTLP